ncbi:MAG: EpsG family protein [Desulfocapsaceae bacterium]|nr:EpsG family protein [Desulfocapsaceae bacterium]
MCDFSGFLIYLISLVLVLSSAVLANKLKILTFTIFLGVGILAAFRGTAGVDTPLYLLRFEYLTFDFVDDIGSFLLLEPISFFMMWLVKYCGGTFSVFSLMYGLILSLLYYYVLRRFPNAVYFAAAILPVIFIDSLFNGIRVGLAYPILFLAISSGSFLLILIAAMVHVSSLLVAPLRYYSLSKVLIVLSLLSLVFILIESAGIHILEYLPSRYVSKMDVYSTLSPSTGYAGFADSIGLCFALIIYYRVSGSRGSQWINISIVTFVVVGFLYYFNIKEYSAALRIVRLLMVAVFALIARCDSKVDRLSYILCIIFGVLYSSNFLRQIVASCSYPEGGFLPLDLTFY